MQYVILTARSFVDLARVVERWMNDGWTPQGGVAIGGKWTVNQPGEAQVSGYDYAQAMVKPELAELTKE